MDSAAYCGFPFSRTQAEEHLISVAKGITWDFARVRLSLDQTGGLAVEYEQFTQRDGPLQVAVDDVLVDPADWRLFHKTSMRRRYREARLRHPEADDVLLVNLDGEVTESTIANVIVRIDGTWVTPPLASGCLPGVMRRVLLEAGEITEAPVLVSDLDRAEELALINSVRLRVPAVLADPVKVSISGRPG